MIIDQLTARGVIEPGALYEPPFTSIHSGGPDALFSGNAQLIGGYSPLDPSRAAQKPFPAAVRLRALAVGFTGVPTSMNRMPSYRSPRLQELA